MQQKAMLIDGQERNVQLGISAKVQSSSQGVVQNTASKCM